MKAVSIEKFQQYLGTPLIHWKASAGKRTGIIGLGVLGQMSVKIAHAFTEVSVLSHSLRKQEDSRRMGADNFNATANPDTFKELKRIF